MKKTLLLILCLFLSFFIQAASAEVVIAEKTVLGGKVRYENFISGLNTLSAHFEQFVLDVDSVESGTLSGTFYLSRPGKFLWDYVKPEKQHILADGDWVWIVDEELAQVTQVSQSSALKNTPALILLGEEKLNVNYEVIELGLRRGLEWLELLPNADIEDSPFVRILLAFNENDLTHLEMTDPFGKISRFIFTDIKRNPELDKKQFKFKAPPGYDLYDI